MSIIEPRPLRIIRTDLETAQKIDDARKRRVDYATLARRSRAQRPPSRAAGSASDDIAAGNGEPGGGELFAGLAGADHEPVEPPSRDDDIATYQHAALAAQVGGATLPAVDALLRQQGRFFELAMALATEVAAFCADQAVGDAGNWEVKIPLDPQVLPDTTLYVSVSRFRLSLRFDTSCTETRQLLLCHSGMLERELDSLLAAWGTPRDIELTIW